MAVLDRGRRPADSAQEFDVLVGRREAFDKLDGLIIALHGPIIALLCRVPLMAIPERWPRRWKTR